jgi:arylsulfate sulfotransferase
MKSNALLAIVCLLLLAASTGCNRKKSKAKEIVFSHNIRTADTSLRGYLLVSGAWEGDAAGNLLVINPQGEKFFEKKVNGAVYEFKQLKLNNKIYYVYSMMDTTTYRSRLSTSIPIGGHYVFLDSAMNELKAIHLLSHGSVTTEKKQDLDVHEIVFLGEDHYIAFSSYEMPVNNIPGDLNPVPNKKVISDIIQEVSNGKVVWQWDPTKHPELYRNSLGGNNFSDTIPADYLHLNAMAVDPKDSNLLVSFRNLNQIIKVDRKTGKILWHLGGLGSDFPLTDDQKFMWQHNVQFMADKNTIQMLDNGSDTKRLYSRIVEMQLDEVNKKVTSFKVYRIPHLYIKQRGSVMNVGENYMISGGSGNYLLIVDPKTDKYLFEAKLNYCNYRGYYVDNIDGIKSKPTTAKN